MRAINKIILHCSATKEGENYTEKDIRRWHTTPKAQGGNGWKDIGYHFVVLLDGNVEVGRPIETIGAHCAGHNADSIGICYVGGLDANGKPKDTRTDAQKKAIEETLKNLIAAYPSVNEIKGHRDYSPDRNGNGKIESWEWIKECPCFDAEPEYKHLLK